MIEREDQPATDGDLIEDVVAVHPDAEVLVVDPEGALADRVELALDDAGHAARVRWVEDYVMALGEIATHGRADVVVGRLESLAGEEEEMKATAHALRELSPHARLLLLVQQRDVPGADLAVRAGFDDYLIEPADLTALGRAVTSRNGNGRGAHAGATSEATQPVESQLLGGESQTPTEPPDDLALFDTLLSVQPGLVDKVVAAAGERFGLAGLTWCEESADAVAGHAVAAVACHGETYGALHASAATDPDALDHAAEWVARWLAIEKRMADLWEMGLKDELTGAWNRRYFNRFLKAIVDRATNERFRVTLMLFDVDDFKSYNDRYGHPAGDEILRQTARLMKSAVREHDVVARVGGDEFAVIFWDKQGPRRPNSQHPAWRPHPVPTRFN